MSIREAMDTGQIVQSRPCIVLLKLLPYNYQLNNFQFGHCTAELLLGDC